MFGRTRKGRSHQVRLRPPRRVGYVSASGFDDLAFTLRGALMSAQLRAPRALRVAVMGSCFLVGLATGLGLSAGTQENVASSSRVEPAYVQPVRGNEVVDDAPEFDPAPRPNGAFEATPPPDGNPSPRAVAERALAVSAFVRGSGVYGAGVVIHPSYVLTCLHVVQPMKQIKVTTAEGVPQPAHVVDQDPKLDLAVLRIDTPSTDFAPLASAFGVRMGDTVFAMGAPRRMTFSFGRGIVSFVGRAYDEQYYLQTDIATNSGSSGGPVLDELGRVIAISSFILRDSHGLAFALPIDQAYRRFQKYFKGSLDTQQFEHWLAERNASAPRKLVSVRP